MGTGKRQIGLMLELHDAHGNSRATIVNHKSGLWKYGLKGTGKYGTKGTMEVVEPIAEPQQNIANFTSSDALPPVSNGTRLFSGSYAKEMARKSAEKRQQIAAENRQAKLMVAAMEVAAKVEPVETYRLNRLARIRAQLASVDSAIENCIKERKPDQSRLKGLVEAQARLADQEQKLSMRPLPGSHRPRTPKADKTSHTVEPLEE